MSATSFESKDGFAFITKEDDGGQITTTTIVDEKTGRGIVIPYYLLEDFVEMKMEHSKLNGEGVEIERNETGASK